MKNLVVLLASLLVACTATPIPTPIQPTTTTEATQATVETTPTPYSNWTYYEPGSTIVCPILVYHRIENPPENALEPDLFVSPGQFAMQMYALRNWGYHTILISDLVNVLKNGGSLPNRPVVITFDDGNESVYTSAFPMMQMINFRGVIYIIERYHSMTLTEMRTILAAGWEMGDHTMTHPNLTSLYENPANSVYDFTDEVEESRNMLEKEFGITISAFAYPFGTTNENVSAAIALFGYTSAVGYRKSNDMGYTQSLSNVYNLNRIRVGNITLAYFANLLPYKGP